MHPDISMRILQLLPAPDGAAATAMPDNEDDAHFEEKRSGRDRRLYPYVRETNWPAIFACLITVLIGMVGYATTILSDIKHDVRVTSDRQIADSATYAAEKLAMRRDIDRAQGDIATVIQAFQYNVNGRLNYLEAKTGFKAPKEALQPPQPPHLQGD